MKTIVIVYEERGIVRLFKDKRENLLAIHLILQWARPNHTPLELSTLWEGFLVGEVIELSPDSRIRRINLVIEDKLPWREDQYIHKNAP